MSSINIVPKFSTNRLPGDHFLSGALIGGISAAALNLPKLKNGELSKSEAIKSTIKYSINGAIVAGFAIKAANNFVNARAFAGLTDVAVGVSLLMISNKLLKDYNV